MICVQIPVRFDENTCSSESLFVLGIAFRANKALQTRIAQQNAIPTLVPLLVDSSQSEETRVEVAFTLACIVLCHADNLQQLHDQQHFSFDVIRQLLCSESEVCTITVAVVLFSYSVCWFSRCDLCQSLLYCTDFLHVCS